MFDLIYNMITVNRTRLSYYMVIYVSLQLMKDKQIMVSSRFYYLIGAILLTVDISF